MKTLLQSVDWSRKPELHINPNKANVVPYTGKHKHLRVIRIYGMELKRTTEVNNLGRTLDQKVL